MTDGRALSGRARIGVTCLVGVVLFLSSPPPVPRRAMADAAAAAGTDGSDAGVPVTNDGSVTVSVRNCSISAVGPAMNEEPSYELRHGGVHGNRRGVRLPGERPEPAHPTRS